MKLLKSIILFVLLFSFYINADANVSISPLKYEITVEKGSSISKNIKITNEDDKPITLYSSSEDFIAWDENWTPVFVKQEEQKYPELSLANWIKIEEKNITLAPWETREISFNVTVPQNWEPGWHYWAIFFSPWVTNWVQVAVVQRIWLLVLINVPWDVKIDWELESFKIWENIEWIFEEKDNFNQFPISFQTLFKNKWNIHIKPKWKIVLIDENGDTLEKIWKESIPSPSWAFIWEKMVDYIPINDWEWNILPNWSRAFESIWKWFGYNVLQEDWTKIVKFKSLTDYYAEKAAENQAYLMFWEQVHTKTVNKKITAKFYLSFESKDLEKKEFEESKDFYVKYDEKYIWINYFLLVWVFVILSLIITYFSVIAPKLRIKKEEELRKKIMEEMKNK